MFRSLPIRIAQISIEPLVFARLQRIDEPEILACDDLRITTFVCVSLCCCMLSRDSTTSMGRRRSRGVFTALGRADVCPCASVKGVEVTSRNEGERGGIKQGVVLSADADSNHIPRCVTQFHPAAHSSFWLRDSHSLGHRCAAWYQCTDIQPPAALLCWTHSH